MTSRTPFANRRHTAAAGLLTALVFVGTACTGGQSPSPAAEQSSSASPVTSTSGPPSATPTPTASYKPADATGRAQNVPVPVLPEVAKTETKEGLEAFARYWFEQLNFAYETGSTSGLKAVTAESCEFCANVTSSLEKNYQGDGWLAGGRLKAPSINTNFNIGADGNYQIVVQVQQSTITYYKPGGSQFRAPTPPSDTGNVMLATFKDGAWRVAGLHPIR